ncbi:hypothetical protein V8G54_029112 [Vigna mungo]|uniref:Uncharacterized protein n=1 Tax=Vigna mungo TaxID=3915 RepID=A0AAQ3MTQ9_VIGMU
MEVSLISESGSSRSGRIRDTPLAARIAFFTKSVSNLQMPRSARSAGLRMLGPKLELCCKASTLVMMESNSSCFPSPSTKKQIPSPFEESFSMISEHLMMMNARVRGENIKSRIRGTPPDAAIIPLLA